MAVTREQVERMATLARLRLSEAEVTSFTAQLGDILAHARELEQIGPAPDVEAGPAAPSPLRADEPGRDEMAILPEAMAPSWVDGFFTLPRLPAMEQ